MIDNATISSIVDRIATRFHPEKIIMFGSCARGNAGNDSDLDLFVVMDSPLPRHKRSTPLRLIFNPQPASMDILVYTPAEVSRWNGVVNHIVTEVFRNGKVLYDRK